MMPLGAEPHKRKRTGYEIKQEFRELGGKRYSPISSQTLAGALQRRNWDISKAEINAMIEFADQNGSGKVNLTEFARLRRILSALDHTETNRLNKEDLRIELKRLGLAAPSEKIEQMIAVADVEKTGRVNLLEFWRLLTVLPLNPGFQSDAMVQLWWQDTDLITARFLAIRDPDLGTMGELIAGTASGVATCLIGHPFDTLKVRMQMEAGSKMVPVIQELGLGGLYRGVENADSYPAPGVTSDRDRNRKHYRPTLTLTLTLTSGLASPMATVPALTGLSFGAYAHAKGVVTSMSDLSGGKAENGCKLNLSQMLLCGAYTGVVCTSIVGPMELVKCHLQAKGGLEKYGGTYACARSIVSEHGVRALFKGV